MRYTKEQYLEYLKKVPEEIRDIISSLDTTHAIRDIGNKYRLHVDKIGLLDEETGAVLLGLAPTAKFAENIKKLIGVDEPTAHAITTDINEKVFLPIRDSLRQLQEKKDKQELNPKQVLAEIENPVAMEPTKKEATKAESNKLFEEKMSKMFNLPREIVDLNALDDRKPGEDPYLEPIK